jgi:hypothetical protein
LRLSKNYNFGDQVEVMLANEHLCNAQIIGKKHFMLDGINSFIAGVDTGYSTEDCQKLLMTMYKNKNVDWSKQPIYFYLVKKVS